MRIRHRDISTKLYVQLISHSSELIVRKIESSDFRKITHLHGSGSRFDVSY